MRKQARRGQASRGEGRRSQPEGNKGIASQKGGRESLSFTPFPFLRKRLLPIPRLSPKGKREGMGKEKQGKDLAYAFAAPIKKPKPAKKKTNINDALLASQIIKTEKQNKKNHK